MAEDFDVKLVEDVEYFTPDPQYKKNAWTGDYQEAYNRFLKDPDGFWSGVARELTGSAHGMRSRNWTTRMRSGSPMHNSTSRPTALTAMSTTRGATR